LDGPTIIVDHLRYGLPFNIEDDLDDFDIDQPDNELLEKSTLFQSIQLVFSMEKGDEMRMGMPFEDHLIINTLALLCKTFIILLLYNLI
jgi:hypothetical protein